jgi:hypothetical protein
MFLSTAIMNFLVIRYRPDSTMVYAVLGAVIDKYGIGKIPRDSGTGT